jgi:hypothetical protein
MTEVEMARPMMSGWLAVSLILSALPFVLSGNRTMHSVGFGLLAAAAASLLT